MTAEQQGRGAWLRAQRDTRGLSRKHVVAALEERGVTATQQALEQWEAGGGMTYPRAVALDEIYELGGDLLERYNLMPPDSPTVADVYRLVEELRTQVTDLVEEVTDMGRTMRSLVRRLTASSADADPRSRVAARR